MVSIDPSVWRKLETRCKAGSSEKAGAAEDSPLNKGKCVNCQAVLWPAKKTIQEHPRAHALSDRVRLLSPISLFLSKVAFF